MNHLSASSLEARWDPPYAVQVPKIRSTLNLSNRCLWIFNLRMWSRSRMLFAISLFLKSCTILCLPKKCVLKLPSKSIWKRYHRCLSYTWSDLSLITLVVYKSCKSQSSTILNWRSIPNGWHLYIDPVPRLPISYLEVSILKEGLWMDEIMVHWRIFVIVVYHHGTSAGGGHYTCDIRRQNGQWLHINDTNIKPLSERDVLLTDKNTRAIDTIHTEQTPYILFYMKAWPVFLSFLL